MIRKLTKDEFEDIAVSKPFDIRFIEKDYFVTVVLYLLRDIPGVFFKGGTALQKIFLDYARLSEDVDFTVTQDVKEIKKKIKKVLEESGFFTRITEDKRVDLFTRLIAHYKGFYDNEGTVFIDLNQKAKLSLKPEQYKIPHFYPESIPDFAVPTMAAKEMFAEKVRATIQRNKPRDHFDVYQIIKKKLPLDMKLIEQKCKEGECELNVIRMFNKAKKLKKKWDGEMDLLIAEEISFPEVMQTLAKHFNLKEEKERLAASKQDK